MVAAMFAAASEFGQRANRRLPLGVATSPDLHANCVTGEGCPAARTPAQKSLDIRQAGGYDFDTGLVAPS